MSLSILLEVLLRNAYLQVMRRSVDGPRCHIEKLACSIALLFMMSLEAAASNAPLKFDGGAAVLDSPWQFRLGDDPAWSNPSFDDRGSEELRPDLPWGLQGHLNIDGFAWYRKHVVLSDGPDSLAILIPAVRDSYELYWNGRLIGSNGAVPPHPTWYLATRPCSFFLGRANSGVLAIRVWKMPFGSFEAGTEAGMSAAPVIGSPQSIQALKSNLYYDWLRSQQVEIAVNLVYGMVAMLSLLAWLRDRRHCVMFWASCFTACKPIFALAYSPIDRLDGGIGISIAGAFLTFGDISLWFLLLWLLDLRDDKRLLKTANILAWIDIAQVVVDSVINTTESWRSPAPWQIADGVMTFIMTGVEIFPFLIMWQAFARRNRLTRARWLVAVTAFVTQTIFVAGFALSQGSRFTHWTAGASISRPLVTIGGNPINALLISGVLLLFAIVYALFQYSSESSRRQSRLEQEIQNAREVQRVLIPDQLPSMRGFRIESEFQPAGEVGGDFFQVILIDTGGLLLVIGDVSGKGLPAAMTVSLLVGTFRTLAHYTQSPGEILGAMNRRMLARSRGGFTTCLVLRVELDGTVVLANAGHIPPYMNGQELQFENGLPLGLAESSEYEESIFQLEQDDRLTLITDGVVEARDRTGSLFGFERTAAIAAQTAQAIADSAKRFGQEDDITVLTLRRQPIF